jgi:hypothetical protein
MQDLVKLISPKNDPPAVLQERVLSLIQVHTLSAVLVRCVVLCSVSQMYGNLHYYCCYYCYY